LAYCKLPAPVFPKQNIFHAQVADAPLFDLQETTAKIRAVTNHLKGVKIAIMGCIVNGPGEMADADFGYVGSGVGKITLYKNKDIVKRNIDSEVAVDELINLLKEHGAWVDNLKI
jgi:(E)-4-hydroxy-3-methylbut-2-enyl-diphosphate synthase